MPSQIVCDFLVLLPFHYLLIICIFQGHVYVHALCLLDILLMMLLRQLV